MGRLKVNVTDLEGSTSASGMITAYEVSDAAAPTLRKPSSPDPVFGVYCGLRLDAKVCGGIGEGGRGMAV